MLNPQEEVIDLKKYLKKLQYIIEYDAKFTLISTKIVDKKKIDDILCCIESAFPTDYKKFVKEKGPYKLNSSKSYLHLYEAVKNKFLFSTDVYSVRFSDAIEAISGIHNNIENDLKLILSGEASKL